MPERETRREKMKKKREEHEARLLNKNPKVPVGENSIHIGFEKLKYPTHIVGFNTHLGQVHLGDTVYWEGPEKTTFYNLITGVNILGVINAGNATLNLGMKVKISCPKSPGH